MEALLKAINEIIEEKDRAISFLKWEKEDLKKENAELKEKVNALEADVEMYQENEENKKHKIGFCEGE